MKYFINYDANTDHLSINTYRQPNGYANSDVAALVDDMLANRSGSCPLEGAKAALEDGSVWRGSNATPETLFLLRALICEHEAEQA